MGHQQYKNATAWMVRRDGGIFPVIQHIYGNVIQIEETLFAAEWLYGHTGWEQTRQDIVDFTVAWVTQLEKETGSEDIRECVYCWIENRPYQSITRKFADKILKWREKADNTGVDRDAENEKNIVDVGNIRESRNTEKCIDIDQDMELAGYCRKITLDLNEEFMRVRFGGLYHTEPGNRKLYFRISSENFNWSEVIMGFLNQTQLDYEEFYVVIDEESVEANPAILKQSRFLRRVSGDE